MAFSSGWKSVISMFFCCAPLTLPGGVPRHRVRLFAISSRLCGGCCLSRGRRCLLLNSTLLQVDDIKALCLPPATESFRSGALCPLCTRTTMTGRGGIYAPSGAACTRDFGSSLFGAWLLLWLLK